MKSALSVREQAQLIMEDDPISHRGYIKGIKELVDSGIDHVPEKYIRPVSERPRASEVCYTDQVPVIDMHGLMRETREQVINEIACAAADGGIFQVINHGVQQSVLEKMCSAVRGFFEQPAMDRMMFYSEEIQKPVVYVTSFNQSKEKVMNWKDSLRFRYSSRLHGFDNLPWICREPAVGYCQEIRSLGDRLYAAFSESLGLGSDLLHEYMGKHANISTSMHYYPPCPDPSLTLGMSGHSDPNLFTILLQDDVGGLEVFKDGRWVSVKPLPRSFVIIIGDQMQIWTNGKYKSVEHRVVTNSERPRLSIPTFFCPADSTMVGPLPQFIDKEHPALYRKTMYADYARHFYTEALARKSGLGFACRANVLGGSEGGEATNMSNSEAGD